MGLMDKAKEVCNSLTQTESGKNQKITKEDEIFNPFALRRWRWDEFLSPKGIDIYSRLQNLEDKTIFIYVFLSRLWPQILEDECYPDFAIEEEMDIRFKFALFLADAIANADLEYSSFPALIDRYKNPYLAYLANTGIVHRKRDTYYAFMSILHGMADPLDSSNWVYQIKTLKDSDLSDKMDEVGKNFYDDNLVSYPNPQVYEIDDKLMSVQLKIKWFFRKD